MKTSIFLTNLGKYNEGELVGEWIDLPIEDDELQEVLKRIGIDDDQYEEYFITDYESDVLKIDEYSNIQSLNEQLEEIQDLCDDHGEELIETMLGEYNNIEDVKHELNNKNCSIREARSYEDLSEGLMEEWGLFEDVPENLRGYIDTARWLKDIESNDGNVVYIGQDQYLLVI